MPANVSIEALAERVRGLRGWRRRAAAFAAGAVSVLAMAPFFAWPVLWITLPTLVWLIDGASSPQGLSSPCRVEDAPAARRRGPTQPSARNASSGVDARLRGHHAARWYRRPELAAAEIGWWFGFGYFVPGLFWIGEAFLVEAETFAVLLPFAVTLLPAGLALFYAAAAAIAARLDRMAHAASWCWR